MKTDKKKIILFILFAIVILALAIWLLVNINKKPGESTQSSLENLFPFGEILSGIGLGDSDNQNSEGENEQEQESQEETGNEVGPQLRLINPEPTGGMVPLTRIEEFETSKVTTDEEGNEQVTTETIEVKNSFIRFSEISNGSVYETRMTGEPLYSEELIVENFLPNAEYSYFSPDGNHVAYQYWSKDTSTIETYLGTIQTPQAAVGVCPFDISGTVVYGQESNTTYQVHQLLNLKQETQVANIGVNSPGNESALASDLTKQAIIKFQTLQGLTGDGAFGSKTRAKMITYCEGIQKEKAESELANTTSSRYQMIGQFLPQNIISINMDPQGSGMFYITKSALGVVGNIKKWLETNTQVIFSSPFSEWTSIWNNKDAIELYTKPSHVAFGFSYDLKTSNGDYHKSFHQRYGLTTLPSPDNTKVLVYDVETGSVQLSIFDRATNKFSPLIIQSFTDKCTWSSDSLFIYCAVPDSLAYGAEYPDTWYQGIETYQDSLYRINVATLEEELLSNISVDYGASIDVERISVDEQDLYLYFINKKDESLWSYRLAA
jgi:hypothetical protein